MNPASRVVTAANIFLPSGAGYSDTVAGMFKTFQRVGPLAPVIISREQMKKPLVLVFDCAGRVPSFWRRLALLSMTSGAVVAHVATGGHDPARLPADELRARATVGLEDAPARALPVLIGRLWERVSKLLERLLALNFQSSGKAHSLRRPGFA